jgi:hypothetical protein
MQDIVHQNAGSCSREGQNTHTHKVERPKKGFLRVVDELAYILCQESEK